MPVDHFRGILVWPLSVQPNDTRDSALIRLQRNAERVTKPWGKPKSFLEVNTGCLEEAHYAASLASGYRVRRAGK